MTPTLAGTAPVYTVWMGRRGHAFLTYWHRRTIDLPNGDTLSWVLIDDPAARRPQAEAFRITSTDGTSRGVHAVEARRLLEAAGHPDDVLVHLDEHVGYGLIH